jgi:hypothetical protein
MLLPGLAPWALLFRAFSAPSLDAQPRWGRFHRSVTQGWRQTAPPTLGFITQPFQGKKPNSPNAKRYMLKVSGNYLSTCFTYCYLQYIAAKHCSNYLSSDSKYGLKINRRHSLQN